MVEDGGTGLEVKVVFQGSDVPEVVVPHLVFSHYVGRREMVVARRESVDCAD